MHPLAARAVILLMVAPLAAGAGAAADSARAALGRAKGAHADRERAFGASVESFLKRREEAARHAGDREALMDVTAAREAYRADGKLPDGLPAGVLANRSRDRSVLERAYDRAIRELTRQGEDAAAAAAAAELKAFLDGSPVGEVDLLATVVPARDTLRGGWGAKGAGVQSAPGQTSALRLRYKPRGEYDLRVRFARVDGVDGMYLLLTFKGTHFAFVMDASDHKSGSQAGFEPVRGKFFFRNRTTANYPEFHPVGRVREAVARVRDEGVTVLIDGVKVASIETDYARDFPVQDPADPDSATLGVSTWKSSFLVLEAKVTPVQGEGAK